MKIDGGCHCGKITYKAEVDADGARVCHCTDCQVLSGSAFRAVVPSVEDGFTLTAGTPKIYVKIADSGSRRAQAFCEDCGTHIYAAAAEDGPKIYGIRLGTVHQRERIAPKSQIWHRSVLPWLDDIGTIDKIEKQS